MKETKDILRQLMGNDMSEGFLSRATGVPQTTIHRILTGAIIESKPSTLRPIAKYFNISISQLQGETPMGGIFDEDPYHESNHCRAKIKQLREQIAEFCKKYSFDSSDWFAMGALVTELENYATQLGTWQAEIEMEHRDDDE